MIAKNLGVKLGILEDCPKLAVGRGKDVLLGNNGA